MATSNRQIIREPAVRLVIWGMTALLLLFVVYPLFKLFVVSFRAGHGISHYGTPLINSIALGVVVSITSTLIGFFFAF
ncbi:MAG: hypothetical protein HYY44_03240 [Deltaproteobacteria bacterium]|nr:hypothetical protein [Deltaproteobacteria bacterium]